MDQIPKVPAWQLAIRFALEVVSVWAIGSATRALVGDTMYGWVAAVGAALFAIVLWVTFNVPGDPSRSGRAPVSVDGAVRLLLELGVFSAGAAGLFVTGRLTAFVIFVLAALLHYAGTLPRLRWLLSQKKP